MKGHHPRRPKARPRASQQGLQKAWGNCSHEPELIEENYTPVFYYKFFCVWLFLNYAVKFNYKGRHIGLLITARASLGLFSAPPYWAVHLQLSQTCFCSGGFGVLCVRACFKNIIWLKLTFPHVIIPILLQF